VKPHTFHPEAEEEYAEAARYYAAIQPELAGRFYDEVEDVIREIRQDPERFFWFDPPAQRHLCRKFPYAVIFLNQPDRVWIVAVMHGKRRPRYWRERLE
jgi:plasmid stabilization system protein ParE